MLRIIIPDVELWDEGEQLFILKKGQNIQLEHSLVSISKWESKWNKAFLGKKEKTFDETIDYMASKGEKVGLVKVRLYRPFSKEALIAAIPDSVKKIIPDCNFNSFHDHYYTCKFHDSISGNCLNYKNRPKMCIKFPENLESFQDVSWTGKCTFKGCTRRYSLSQLIVMSYKRIVFNMKNKINILYYYKYYNLFHPFKRYFCEKKEIDVEKADV